MARLPKLLRQLGAIGLSLVQAITVRDQHDAGAKFGNINPRLDAKYVG